MLSLDHMVLESRNKIIGKNINYYNILKKLSNGSMGTVYKAQEPKRVLVTGFRRGEWIKTIRLEVVRRKSNVVFSKEDLTCSWK